MRSGLRAKRRAGVLAAAVVVGAACLGVAGGGGPADAQTLPGGTWGEPQAIPGLAALSSPHVSSAISCASLGNCTAVGSYDSANGAYRPFAATETDGAWGNARSLVGVPGAPASIGPLQKVSCGAPGYCAAFGIYYDNNGGFAYLATEVKGAWSVRTLPGTIGLDTVLGSHFTSVACTSAGDCTAVGSYGTTSNGSSVTRAFTLDESGGTWGTPQPVAGLPPGGGSPSPTWTVLNSVSCSGPGDCTVGGNYSTASGYVPFLVSESGGTWGSPQAVSGFAALTSSRDTLGTVTSVSCPDASDCAVAGTYADDTGGSGAPVAVFTVDEVRGTWGPAKALLDVPSQVSVNGSNTTVGCRAAGNCVVTGSTLAGADTPLGTVNEAFAATETKGGSWGQEQALAGIPAGDSSGLGGLSCVPDKDCTVAGVYIISAASHEIFAATIGTDGTIGAVQPVQSTGNITVNGLDCPQDGYCTLVEDAGNAQLLTEANPASVTLTPSAPKVSYGTAETFTATVSSTAGGTPTGTVTVTGPSGAACTITLSAGTGKCSFSPAQFPVGTDTATGSYNGDSYYLTASATASVTVAKGKTATRLTPSAAVITLGQGTTDTLTVTVSHASGTTAPTGIVQVRDGTFAVCTITLADGTGNCTVNADQLITHGRVLTAAYPGNGNFLASTSPPVYLSVTPAAPRLAWPAAGRPASPADRLHGRPALPVG